MKALVLSIALLAGYMLQAQSPDYVCTVKKDCFVTDMLHQKQSVAVKVGEQYRVAGSEGHMLLIYVHSKKYYISTGCVSLFKTTGNGSRNDTTAIPYDSLPRYKEN